MNEPTKATLIRYIEQGRATERAWAESLSQAERDVHGAKEKWVAKNELMHINSWKSVLVEELEAARQGASHPHYEDQAFNDATFDRWNEASWEKINAEADRATVGLNAELAYLSEEALTTPGYYEWLRQETITKRIIGTVILHSYQHLAEFSYRRGDHAKVDELISEIDNVTRAIGGTPHDVGTNLYNLACACALTDRTPQAIAYLGEALALRPTLIEWSHQDSDLDSLRGEAAFQALYN